MLFRRFLLIAFLLLLFSVALIIALTTQPFVFQQKDKFSVYPNEQILKQHVEYFSRALFPRNLREPQHLEQAATYIENEFSKYSPSVKRQTFFVESQTGNSQPVSNLIAHFGPQQGPVTIIGAHYDSEGITPGADDNASGVAGLLELARLFSIKPPTHAIELVAYTLEEPPYFRTEKMGSYIHAKSLIDSGRQVSLMISLEMIGYFSNEENSQSFPVNAMKLFYPTKGNFISLVSRFSDWQETRKLKSAFLSTSSLPVYSINSSAIIPGVDYSDHLNYWAFDIPAIMVTDTSFYRNHEYHLAGDTADRLNYNSMADVVKSVFAFCME